MSRSRRDQRGKRINGEIGETPAIKGGGTELHLDYGWESVGDPEAKRDAKREASRMRRRIGKTIIKKEMVE